jgi:hypothetical protein
VTAAIRIVIIVPGIIGVIVAAVIERIKRTVFVIIVPVIEVAPLAVIANFHPEESVVIIFLIVHLVSFISNLVTVTVFIIILWFCSGIIHIIGGLAGAIGSAASGERSSGDQCQDK